MATVYPGSLDDWQDPVGSDALSTSPDGRTHAQHHSDLSDVALSMEAQLVGPVFTSSAAYDDLAEDLIVDAESLTPGDGTWVVSAPQAGDAPSLDTAVKNQGSSSVQCDVKFPSGADGKLYFEFTSPLSIGSYTAATIDLLYEVGNGSGAQRGFDAIVTDGAGLTGTAVTSAIVQSDDAPDAWFTMTLPLAGLTSIKCIGIHKRTGASGGSSSKYVKWWVDNIKLREATAVDVALGDVDGAVVVPSDYVASVDQHADTYSAARSVLDLRTASANLAGIGGVYNLRDWRLDETGTEDVTADVQRILDMLDDGTTLKAPSTAVFRIDDTIVVGDGKRHITFDGQGSRWVQPNEINAELFTLTGTENTIRGVRGFSLNNTTGTPEGWVAGDAQHPIVGSPTAVGTTVQLNDISEQVEVPWKAADEVAYWARDHLGINRWDFTLSDSNQVANDCKFTIMQQDGTVLQTTTQTLTSTPTVYQVTYTPVDIYLPLRVAISKATATTNTITISGDTLYGRQTYDASLAFNHLIKADASSVSCRVIDCWGEGMGGDTVTTGTAQGLHIERVTGRVVGRQGVSFNTGRHITMRNCEIIAAARHSIDLEPETTNVYVSDVTFENCRFIDPGLGHVACTGWPRVRKVHMRNCDFVATADRGGAFFSGGWWEGTLENCSFIRAVDSAPNNVEFTGRGVSINNCTATGGLTLMASAAVKKDENGVFQTADYISVNGWRAYLPSTLFISNITNYSNVNGVSLGGSYAEQYPG